LLSAALIAPGLGAEQGILTFVFGPSSLEAARQSARAAAATAHPGTRVVVAVLNSPSFSSDGEHTLENLGQICQAHGVRAMPHSFPTFGHLRK
jgi:hypothetical protein